MKFSCSVFDSMYSEYIVLWDISSKEQLSNFDSDIKGVSEN